MAQRPTARLSPALAMAFAVPVLIAACEASATVTVAPTARRPDPARERRRTGRRDAARRPCHPWATSQQDTN